MTVNLVTPQNTFDFPVYNALVPKEGPRCVPFIVPFSSAAGPYLIDLQQMVAQKRMTVVQSVFIDNSGNNAPVTLNVGGSSQNIVCPADSQGYWPVLSPAVPRFTVSSSGTGNVQVIFINVPVPADVWQATNVVTIAQPVATNVEGGIAAAKLTSGSAQTVAATSTQLVPIPPSGSWNYIGIQAPLTADLWINPLGGTAGVSAADCFRIAEGTLWQSSGPAIGGPITYYCATGSLQIGCLYG